MHYKMGSSLLIEGMSDALEAKSLFIYCSKFDIAGYVVQLQFGTLLGQAIYTV